MLRAVSDADFSAAFGAFSISPPCVLVADVGLEPRVLISADESSVSGGSSLWPARGRSGELERSLAGVGGDIVGALGLSINRSRWCGSKDTGSGVGGLGVGA